MFVRERRVLSHSKHIYVQKGSERLTMPPKKLRSRPVDVDPSHMEFCTNDPFSPLRSITLFQGENQVQKEKVASRYNKAISPELNPFFLYSTERKRATRSEMQLQEVKVPKAVL